MKPQNNNSCFFRARQLASNFTRTLAGVIVLLGAFGIARAGVVDPGQPVAGKSQLELSEQWLQWALSIPAPSNPLLDTTGAYAQVNNDGPVFFVAGNTSGGSSARTFTVPAGRPIFFPVINAFDLEVPTDGCNVTCAFSFIPWVGGATNLHATLDGQNLLTFPSFRQTSTAFFVVDLPASLRDAFGFPSQYVGKLDAISDGYWVAVDGLSAGPHTLAFGGTFPDINFSLEVADAITVPEPGTLGLILLGTLAALGRRRQMQINEV